MMKKNIPPILGLYKQISKNHLQSNSIETDELWYSRLIGRKISIYFTWMFLHLGLTPNQSTFISFFVGIIGLILLSFPQFYLLVTGFIFFHLYIIIDSSDGEMARFLDMRSALGAFYDKLLHYVMKIGILIVIGVQLFLRTGDSRLLIISLITALLSGFSSTFYYLLPKNNTVSYSDQVKADGKLIGLARKVFRTLTGDIELSILLLVLIFLEMVLNLYLTPILFALLITQLGLFIAFIIQQLIISRN